MTDRRALLIGVPKCDGELFRPIDLVVAADIKRMKDALGQSGYDVRLCGHDDPADEEPTKNRISAALRRAYEEAPADGILVLYFSGHGVIADGQSFLVPSDVYADRTGRRPEPDSLVPVVSGDLEHCRAGLVIFFVDSCRDDPAEPLTVQPAGGALSYPAGGDFVLVNSCRPGQRSLYANTGSFFTQALAEALDRRSPARTLDDVYKDVIQRMARKAARTPGMEQKPEIVRARRGTGKDRGAMAICEGDQVTDAWRRGVENSRLWTQADADTGPVRGAVLGIVADCATAWQSAQGFLNDRAEVSDQWSTQDYPARVVAAVETCLPPGVELTPQEAGILVAVPFLREAVLAAGLREAATIAPTDFSRTFRDGPRSDLEITHSIHEHVCRRAEGLAKRGRLDARDALATWLVHRWQNTRPRIWEGPTAEALCRRLAAAVSGGELTLGELSSVLRALLQGVGADAGDRRFLERVRRADFGPRTRGLAALLCLAGTMAADPRRMPTVVVDHIGIGAELQLSALQTATAELRWRPNGTTFELTATCDHPALHAAFTALVDQANGALSDLRGLALDDGLTCGLPRRFTDARLRPEHYDGTPAYETPLQRFRLSDEKVRELLMGRQLYGDPSLAIRELYQNSLDACRYRRTRRLYLERTRRPVVAWEGSIEFRQDEDEEGRAYIECVDNGVGMSVEALMNTFANAGERFVHRQDFRYEQARWQDLDEPLSLVPNSQFGVGVFSYFMIADEIEIVTRPVNENDLVSGQAHRVRIASSGSLFQITPSTEQPAGGTRVRLYLTGDDQISVLRTLRRLLWVAEFHVTVAEPGLGEETWEPERLRYAEATAAPLRYDRNLWWVSGEGGLAADGIRTDEETYGFVVNLRETHRPRFTVDRNKLRSWDKKWVRQEIRDSLPLLAEWPGLTLSWLWEVTKATPEVAQDIYEYLVREDREIPVGGPWGRSVSVPLHQTGCLPSDLAIFTGGYWSSSVAPYTWPHAWRHGVWGAAALGAAGLQRATVTCLDGIPTVAPLDADLLDTIYDAPRYRQRGDQPLVDTLLELAGHDEIPLAERVRRLRRFAITGLDVSAARGIPMLDRTFDEDDQPLLQALAAWSPPGEPPRTAVGRWLGRASLDLHLPLGEVIRRASELVPHWSAPVGELGELHDYVFTDADLRLLSNDVDGKAPWIGPDVTPAQVVRASLELGRTVTGVLAHFRRFAPLGYRVIGHDRFPDDLTTVELEALRHVDELGQPLRPLHLFAIAARTSMSTNETHKALRRLASAGFVRLPDIGALPDATPTEEEQRLLSSDLVFSDYYTNRVRVLNTDWWGLLGVAWTIGRPDFDGFDGKLTTYRRILDWIRPDRPITVPEIVSLAYYLDLDIASAARHLDRLLPGSTHLSEMGPAVLESTVTCHRPEDAVVLLDTLWSEIARGESPKWNLRPAHIIEGAAMARQSLGAYLTWMAPFRAMGAPVPEPDPSALEDLGRIVPDVYDRALLMGRDEINRYLPIDRVAALWLVQTAGKFGWTVSYTHERMARFVPLGLTLEYPADACFDEIVHWQDLLVITEYLDGQEPALSGVVGPDHVETAAAELGESPSRVRERLHRYAPLFGFRLSG